jgi:hypothetical protein
MHVESTSFNFFVATGVTLLLVFITVLLHYEALRLISLLLPRLKMQPRLRILVVIYGIFLAHTLEVWIFALAYYLLSQSMDIDAFGGSLSNSFFDYVYFSVIVYTSVGFGDVYPLDHIRLISGVEALTGLLMIGWSASFTYLMMEKLWADHPRRRQK